MDIKDLIVIGGGINGTGIAVDAAGRGLSVLLLEAHDLACATSSASSKLIHGGLRYLEKCEFRLVREALAEREILLKMAPHITLPMRFRLPHRPHLRSAWLIRLGLFIYDHLSKRTSLPTSKEVRFGDTTILKPDIIRSFEYSDCWVDDSRLVVLNAQELIKHGSEVKTNMEVIRAYRNNGLWQVEAKDNLSNSIYTWYAKGLVNATGPWVKKFITDKINIPSPYNLRMIKGSHIVVRQKQNCQHAYILQNEDKRIVFVIPWMDEFSIIGTTDVEYHGDPKLVMINDDEIEYLLKVYNAHFKIPLYKKDIIWTYSGVRPLCDDDSTSPQTITRDYTLSLNDDNGKTPLLSVFGGKLTTYRKLAEHSLKKLAKYYPYTKIKISWTHNAILPGGDFEGSCNDYAIALKKNFDFLPDKLVRRYSRTYGTNSEKLLNGVKSFKDLGKNFGHDLYEVELYYLVKYEWVIKLDDAIWRRTKLGIWLNQQQKNNISEWLYNNTKNNF